MSLKTQIETDLKQAMRDQDVVKRETLRMLISGMKYKRIELGRELELPEEVAVLQKAHKMRLESAEAFTTGGRPELAEKERREAGLIEAYLPKSLGEPETRALVQKIAAELGVTEKKQMGQVLKTVMARHKGEVDGKLVQKVAGEILK